jgi:hypothetical protein
MRTQSESQIPNAGGVRDSMLDAGPFIFHNSHLSKHPGSSNKACPVCRPGLGKAPGIVEILSQPSVGESGGDDKEYPTSSASDSLFRTLFDEPDGGVSEES